MMYIWDSQCTNRHSLARLDTTELIHTALVSIHQAMHATEKGEQMLLAPVDNNGNTIAHLAVERGQVSVFKVMIVCIWTGCN